MLVPEPAHTLLADLLHHKGQSIRTSVDPLSGIIPPEMQGVLIWSVDQLDSYGGITATLKRAIVLPPCAENRSVGVVIGGRSTWRATRWLEGDFNR